MKGRVGSKHYDTDKATLIDTLLNGMQIYRKRGRSSEFFMYNPEGSTAKEKFFDLLPEQVEKYIPENTKSKVSISNSNTIRFTPYDIERIRQHAFRNGMPMSKFLLMLVDEYERQQK